MQLGLVPFEAMAGLFGMMAGWVAAGPDAAAARVVGLLAAPRRRPYRRVWRAVAERRQPRMAAVSWRALSIELCQALAAELASGRSAHEALAKAISSVSQPEAAALIPVAAAARGGGDVATALRRAAPATGGEGLLRLAACWQVSVAAGGGLSALIDRVAASLREAEAHRQDLAAQLAGPRATARLLAGLPVLGLLMGACLGMSPLSFLLGGPAGYACLITGLALDGAGVWWTHRLVAGAEEPRNRRGGRDR